ncbi:Hypp2073 [Branchiostoma lanceolatum]|uniref:Hypp2073 protein n=1 Tax=Branchiostoma lanceolatum TaxID=7740 RepID=A0A8K0ELM7_BRALA|nr:Hypp2073 [Branchiostoma lanceolatum]
MKRLLVLAAILVVGRAQGWNEGDSDPEDALKTGEQKGERLLSLLLNKLMHDRRDKTGDVGEAELETHELATRNEQVSCSKRGQIDEGLEGLTRLCSACLYVKQLGNDYHPPIVNEVRCDPDTRCLSGFGQCKQRTQPIRVMRQVGGNWHDASINVGVGCECGVLYGSPLHETIMN